MGLTLEWIGLDAYHTLNIYADIVMNNRGREIFKSKKTLQRIESSLDSIVDYLCIFYRLKGRKSRIRERILNCLKYFFL